MAGGAVAATGNPYDSRQSLGARPRVVRRAPTAPLCSGPAVYTPVPVTDATQAHAEATPVNGSAPRSVSPKPGQASGTSPLLQFPPSRRGSLSASAGVARMPSAHVDGTKIAAVLSQSVERARTPMWTSVPAQQAHVDVVKTAASPSGDGPRMPMWTSVPSQQAAIGRRGSRSFAVRSMSPIQRDRTLSPRSPASPVLGSTHTPVAEGDTSPCRTQPPQLRSPSMTTVNALTLQRLQPVAAAPGGYPSARIRTGSAYPASPRSGKCTGPACTSSATLCATSAAESDAAAQQSPQAPRARRTLQVGGLATPENLTTRGQQLTGRPNPQPVQQRRFVSPTPPTPGGPPTMVASVRAASPGASPTSSAPMRVPIGARHVVQQARPPDSLQAEFAEKAVHFFGAVDQAKRSGEYKSRSCPRRSVTEMQLDGEVESIWD